MRRFTPLLVVALLLTATSPALAQPTADAAETQAEIYAARTYPDFTSTSTCTPIGVDSDMKMACTIRLGVQGEPLDATATVRCNASPYSFKLGLCTDRN